MIKVFAKKNVLKNIIHLYGFNIAKILFPLITLPYLARILSVDAYGVVAYVRSIMVYMQLAVDFGFMLSATKDIVDAGDDRNKISSVTATVLLARIFLAAASFAVLVLLVFIIPILSGYKLYTLLSFVPVFLSVFLFDFVFKGLEKMHIISTRFILMKSIALVLTFVLIKDDSGLLWIPVLDIIGSACAVVLVLFQLKKQGITLNFKKANDVFGNIGRSFNYFISNLATTAFNAFNTVVIGIVLTAAEVAYWGVCMQIVGGIQALYNPVIDGVYPDMVRTKDLRQIYRLAGIFMPVIAVGCIFTWFFAGLGLRIVGGEDYVPADFLLKLLIPVLFFGFPAMLFGWPALGAIEKPKLVAITTVSAAVLQVAGVFVLIVSGSFTLKSVAIMRGFTEVYLFLSRFILTQKHKNCFNKVSEE